MPPSRGKTFTDELAASLVETLKNSGHISCIHENDWGRFYAVVDRLDRAAEKAEKAIENIEAKVVENTIDIVKIKTERRVMERVAIFLSGGGILGVFYTLWGKLFSSHG